MKLKSCALGVCLTALVRGAEIAGQIVDPSGATVAGVVVGLQCTGTARQESVTDPEGRFRFAAAADARCQMRVDAPGFKPVVATVRAGAASRHVLELAAQSAEVTVAASVVDNMDTVALERSLIAGLPVAGNEVLAALADFLDSPAIGSAGSSVIVDGLESPARRIPAALIQEVRINDNPYSAEYSRPGRGRIEIVTRKGEPQFHGSLEFNFRDSALDARNAFAASKPSEQRREWDGSFSGPVRKGSKTTFFTSFEREAADEQALVLARTPDGEVRRNWPTPSRDIEWNFAVTAPAGESGSRTLRYEYGADSADHDGVGGFRLPETGVFSSEREHTLRYSHLAVFSPRLVGEFHVRGGYSADREWSAQSGVKRLIVQEAFTGGGAQVDRSGVGFEAQVSAVLSWNRGRHSLKGGVNVPGLTRETYRDQSNTDGTWSFATLDDHLQGRPFSFAQQVGSARFRVSQRDVALFLQHDVRAHARLSLAFGVRYERQNFLRDGNNLALRVSAAYAADRSRRIVLRAGAGIFYDRAPGGAWADVLRSDPARTRQLLIANPGYPDPFEGGTLESPRPANIVRFAEALRSPYSMHYSAGVEWKAAERSTVTLTYSGARGVKLFRSRDWNAPRDGVRPDPSIAILRVVEGPASMTNHALEAGWRGSWRQRAQGMIRYTLSKTMDNTGGLSWLPPDSFDLSREWARSDQDRRHRFQLLGSCKPWNAFSLGAILSLDSGGPYGITTGRDENGDGRANDRPPGIGAQHRTGARRDAVRSSHGAPVCGSQRRPAS